MGEIDVSELLTVQQAICAIELLPASPRVVSMPVRSAVGCAVARDYFAPNDYPPFDRSFMDGYAVRSCDLPEGKGRLAIAGEVLAGRVFSGTVQAGETVKIMTGAPVPEGADAVVPVEHTHADGRWVSIDSPHLRPGSAIAPRGSDCTAGTAVLPAGTILTPAHIAVAATIGLAEVSVYDRPTVSVLSTGDEIAHADGASSINDANGPMLATLLERLGCRVERVDVADDDPARLRAALQLGMQSDLLVSSGGVSMGDADHVPALLRELGVSLAITKLRIKPGKPFVLGSHARGFAIGLPGNPVSAFCCTLRLARRLIDRLAGRAPSERWIELPLADPISANGPREFYQPAVIESGRIRVLPWKGSADVFTLSAASILVVRPIDDAARFAGELVRAMEIER
jgi:molybdopterin molybdotransferase